MQTTDGGSDFGSHPTSGVRLFLQLLAGYLVSLLALWTFWGSRYFACLLLVGCAPGRRCFGFSAARAAGLSGQWGDACLTMSSLMVARDTL